MATAKIIIDRLIQDSQEYGSDDEYMVSRVFFQLEINGKKYENLCADIKQIVGSSIESSPLEVSAPLNYEGPLNYMAFRNIVEGYFRSLVGSKGSGIRISSSSKNIRMYNNLFQSPFTTSFEVDISSGKKKH